MNTLDIASRALGLNESDKAAALSDYLTTGGQNLDPATTAWCAAFVNSTLQQGGMSGTNSLAARSFLDWGQPVDQPQPGDIAVFSRGDPNGWQGHVGFFQGYNPDGTINILGGNQDDSVSVAAYSPDELLGFRRGEQSPQPQNALAGWQAQQQQQTNALRNDYTPMDASAFMVARRPPPKLAFS